MGAPGAFLGVHSVAKGRAFVRFFQPLQNLAGDTDFRFFGLDMADLESVFRHQNPTYSGRSPQPLMRDRADAAPVAVHGLKDALDDRLGRLVAFVGHRAGYAFLTSTSPFSSICTVSQDTLDQIERLEPGDRDRDAVLLGNGRVFPVAHHRADMPGGQKTLHPVVRRAQNGMHGRWNAHVGDQHRIILQPQRLGLQHAHGVGRSGGLETDGEENHLFIRVFLGDPHRVQR